MPLPTAMPTHKPSREPSAQPSFHPVPLLSAAPAPAPSLNPTLKPVSQPTFFESKRPSPLPSAMPVPLPSSKPSEQPSWTPTSKPVDSTFSPTTADTVVVAVEVQLVADTAEPSTVQKAELLTAVATNTGLTESAIVDFTVTSSQLTARQRQRRRLLASYLWSASFTVEASLAVVGFASADALASSIAADLVDPSFQAAVSSSVGGVTLDVDETAITAAPITRSPTALPTQDPTVALQSPPTHSEAAAEIAADSTSKSKSSSKNSGGAAGLFDAASLGLYAVLGIAGALSLLVGCFVCVRRARKGGGDKDDEDGGWGSSRLSTNATGMDLEDLFRESMSDSMVGGDMKTGSSIASNSSSTKTSGVGSFAAPAAGAIKFSDFFSGGSSQQQPTKKTTSATRSALAEIELGSMYQEGSDGGGGYMGGTLSGGLDDEDDKDDKGSGNDDEGGYSGRLGSTKPHAAALQRLRASSSSTGANPALLPKALEIQEDPAFSILAAPVTIDDVMAAAAAHANDSDNYI